MSDLFDSYEEEFNELRLQVEQRIRNIPTYEGSQKRSEVQKAESELKELDQIIRKMNLSGRSNARLVPKIKEYEQEISRLRSGIRRADMSVSQHDRGELFSGVKLDDVMSGSMSQRERLISANERLDKTSSDIDYGIQIVEEAVHDGAVTLEEMDRQTNQLNKMRGDLRDIDSTIGKARKIMRTMARRAWANKIILAVIALVMIAGICLIIYVKWIKSDTLPVVATTTTSYSTSATLTSGYSTTNGITSGAVTTG